MARLISLQTAPCQTLVLPSRGGPGNIQTVQSGIRKTVVSSLAEPNLIRLGAMGLEGDEQADLSVHGGRDKALYAYPQEHHDHWQRFLDQADSSSRTRRAISPGMFGENLCTEGLTEDTVFIGDVWELGDVCLRVTAPREPCYKFNAVMQHPQASRQMFKSRQCGWYLQVLTPGVLQAGLEIQVQAGERRLSVAQALMLKARPTDL